jgi:hypothetical protein
LDTAAVFKNAKVAKSKKQENRKTYTYKKRVPAPEGQRGEIEKMSAKNMVRSIFYLFIYYQFDTLSEGGGRSS